MFHVEESDFGNYRQYRFHHPELGHGFDIVPALGANVTAIRFGGTNVLEGAKSPEDILEGPWGNSDILFPFPNRLRDGRYFWRGRDYAFPLNNGVMGNAIHGLVRHLPFEPTRIELTTISASMSSRLDYPGTNPAYPFPFIFNVTFTITTQNEFIARFSVTNRHAESIPVGIGWHPYFRLAERADDHLIQFPPCARIDIDDRMIPTGTRSPYPDFQQEKPFGSTVLDTCFAVSPNETTSRITMKANGQTLAIESPRATFPFFQIYTPPSRSSIAIEPMTCNIDAFRNGQGLVEVAPSIPAAWTSEFRVVYARDDK